MRLAGISRMLVALVALAACGKSGSGSPVPVANTTSVTTTSSTMVAPTVSTTGEVASTASPAGGPIPANGGFDPAAAPTGRAPSEAWPYFGLIDGYSRMVRGHGDSQEQYEKKVEFDRYEFFDGTKLIPVEGRLITLRGDGKDASFFQVQKTYEKLVHDLGGVTVFEGKGQTMVDEKIQFGEGRHRALHVLEDEQMGVYMVRAPYRQIWVEVYKVWYPANDNYWLTIVETKPLGVKMNALSSDDMKKELDASGQVALYINFDTDKTSIRPDSRSVVGEVVKLLTNNPDLKLEVQGHTDNVGAPAHNQTLSEGRANAVVGALAAQGIVMSRLQPKGYGQSKPLTDNATEDGRAKNRRVELVKR